MICKECGTKNRIKANYCMHCGHQFTDQQREYAYSKTIFGWIEKIENIWSILTLDKITGSSLFKIISLVIIFLVGSYSVYKNGTQFRPLEHENYEIQYNQKVNEYYLISDLDSFEVSLYLPKTTDELTVLQLNEYNELICEEQYLLSDEIVLNNQEEILYQIEAAGHIVQIRTFKK